MKYIVQIRIRGKWQRTWWTDSDAPESAGLITDADPVAVNKSKAERALALARDMYPEATYRLAAV